jgi:HK97 family phage portal protein
MINNLFKLKSKNDKKTNYSKELKSFLPIMNRPIKWYDNNYASYVQNGYMQNVIAFRCVNMISKQASCIPIKIYKRLKNNTKQYQTSHVLYDLFKKPNENEGYASFMERVFSMLLISGNVFILLEKTQTSGIPLSLKVLRSDRVTILSNSNGDICYKYYNEETKEILEYTNTCEDKTILHIKSFNPLNDHYGLSPFEVAKYAIEQHNESSRFNKALLENFARPSGALVVRGSESNKDASLTDDQYYRLKEQIDSYFSQQNAGRPMLLEGGLDWKEMSISPRDMDFIESRNVAAREIALCFGVPSQLIGIQGDNTYSNMKEAKIGLWSQTIIPTANYVINCLEDFLNNHIASPVDIELDKEQIAILSSQRDTEWDRVSQINFLTLNEKRNILGFEPIEGGDDLAMLQK